MADPTTSPASATLAGIAAEMDWLTRCAPAVAVSPEAFDLGELMPRYARAALEAVLAPHQPGRRVVFGSTCKRHEAHRHFSITSAEADDVRACPDCSATVYTSCTGCVTGVSVDACPVRLAITAALTGKEAST